MYHSTRRGPVTPRRGKTSRKARNEKRRRAEEAQRRRKEERERRKQKPTPKPGHHSVSGNTAEDRYYARQLAFARRYGRAGRLLHVGAWVTHNCVAHPLLGLRPGRRTVALHDRTADWLNLSPTSTRSPLPEIPSRLLWMVHNCVAHPIMGVAPRSTLFDAHESTAEAMDVHGWV